MRSKTAAAFQTAETVRARQKDEIIESNRQKILSLQRSMGSLQRTKDQTIKENHDWIQKLYLVVLFLVVHSFLLHIINMGLSWIRFSNKLDCFWKELVAVANNYKLIHL